MKQDVLHLKSPVNWINDPNGFIYYKGKYHLFYQHFPYAPIWGTMHWGHAVSEDLVHWEHKKIALFPTKSYDRNGVFSGSAIEKDEKLYFYYSAVRYLEQDEENIHLSKNDQIETSQAMLISEDGEKFDNWNGKKQIIPVIRDEEIADARDTRDPKVWKEDEKYYMVLGSTYHGKQARVLIFESEDGENWNYKSQCRKETYGHTMECPDLFKIREQYIFVGSPMGIQNDGLEYANQSVCALAKFDVKAGELSLPDEYQMVDYGGDFYAPQSNLDKDGRRVMIAWMKSWDSCVIKEKQRWQGMMTLPRELEYRDGKIWQKPVREIENYRKNRCCYENVKVGESLSLEGVRGRMIDLIVELQNADGIVDGSRNSGNQNQEALDVYNEFRIELARNEEYTTVFTYDRKRQILEIDRTWSGVQRDVVCTRKLQITDGRQNLKLRFILDRSSIELFINDGSKTATTVIPTPVEADEILFHSDGNAVIQVEKYDIVL